MKNHFTHTHTMSQNYSHTSTGNIMAWYLWKICNTIMSEMLWYHLVHKTVCYLCSAGAVLYILASTSLHTWLGCDVFLAGCLESARSIPDRRLDQLIDHTDNMPDYIFCHEDHKDQCGHTGIDHAWHGSGSSGARHCVQDQCKYQTGRGLLPISLLFLINLCNYFM